MKEWHRATKLLFIWVGAWGIVITGLIYLLFMKGR
jgi:hypothetical protein